MPGLCEEVMKQLELLVDSFGRHGDSSKEATKQLEYAGLKYIYTAVKAGSCRAKFKDPRRTRGEREL